MPNRTKNITEILQYAKIKESDVQPYFQTLYFTQNNDSDKYKLLQLTPELEKEICEGNTLTIKGYDNDEVVLCSESQTFNVTEAETSNSLLFVKNLKFNGDIIKDNVSEQIVNKVEITTVLQEYLAAVVGKPHLNRLQEILSQTVYRGPELEYDINKDTLYTYAQLTEVIQASNKELKTALESMDVVIVDSKVRLLDFEYHFKVLSYMLKLIEENSWELDEIDYQETVSALRELVPTDILNNLFDKYAHESKLIDSQQLYVYDEAKVCQFFAKVLLHDAGKFNLEEFLQAWRESVPEGMSPDEDMLCGIAIIDRKRRPNVISAFEESDLPEDINERFRVLFDVKEKWTVPEITPYIKKLATEKLDVNALLAKYARASKENGVKCYSAKHGK